MAKIVKKIKKVSQKIKSLSSRTRKVLHKAVSRKKRIPQAKPRLESPMRAVRVAARPKRKAKPAAVLGYPESKIAHMAEALVSPSPAVQRLELPQKYDKDIIVAQVRDPWWLYAYWEVRDATYQRLKGELGGFFDSAKKALRVYDVSYINFNGSNAHRLFDIEVAHDANSWYIDTGGPGRSWCVDLGLKLSDGRFIVIARSNIVMTPLEGPSWITDEEWMVPDELFAKLYTSAAGLGGSPVRLKKPWAALEKQNIFSGGISSAGASPVKKQERKFWLIVNTELILYGATEPEAKVTVQGKPVALRPDGTFSLRFSLPDGKQDFPVKAKSSDGIDERAITPAVIKETK